MGKVKKLAVLSLAALLLTGMLSSAAMADDNVVLTVEASQEILNNIPYAVYEENIAAFEELYPNITVEMVLNPDAQNTSILHYCGKEKPWHPRYRYRFGSLYRHYEHMAELELTEQEPYL